MKIINIVFYLPSKEKRENPYISEKTYERHKDFMSYFPKNVVFYVATHVSQYLWHDTFSPKFLCIENVWKENKNQEIKADLILWMIWGIDATNIYHNPIREICKDKKIIEILFPHLTFTSIVCDNYHEIKNNFSKIKWETKVLKPTLLSQWEWIFITPSIPKEEKLAWMYPYLIQEFMDTSIWFEWYTWIHDFRVVVINGMISGAFLRIAPSGVLQANVKLGATTIDFGEKNIPEYIQNIIEQVEIYCREKYPQRYYSIDIWVGKNKEIKIFELNSSPALSTPSIRKWLAEDIIKNILKLS